MPTLRGRLDTLWTTVPREHPVWLQVEPGLDPKYRWREVVELICGAIWHMEHAVQVGELDSQQYDALRRVDLRPWETWLESRCAIQRGLTSRAHASELVATNIQSMLLGDSVLRLAGAWQILEDSWNSKLYPAVSKLGRLRDVFDKDGSTKPNIDSRLSSLLVLTEIRDTFMHGELSPRQANNQGCVIHRAKFLM